MHVNMVVIDNLLVDFLHMLVCVCRFMHFAYHMASKLLGLMHVELIYFLLALCIGLRSTGFLS